MTEKIEKKEERPVCDFCGGPLNGERIDRKRYCSKSCQTRAGQGRVRVRLKDRNTNRTEARLKLSDPLYFS